MNIADLCLRTQMSDYSFLFLYLHFAVCKKCLVPLGGLYSMSTFSAIKDTKVCAKQHKAYDFTISIN
jgi:hypothetical protein